MHEQLTIFPAGLIHICIRVGQSAIVTIYRGGSRTYHGAVNCVKRGISSAYYS